MKWIRQSYPIIITLVVIQWCVACGGGGDGIEGSGLRGTVAIGEPLTNTQVTIKGKTGNKITTMTGSDGKYQADVSQLVAPYILQVAKSSTTNLYSIATEPGVANIHPFSDAVSRNWFGNKQRNIDSEFNSANELISPPITSEINSIINSLNNILHISYENFQVTQNFNFITQVFDANHSGFDLLLDQSIIRIIDNILDVRLVEPETLLETSIINLELDQLLPTLDNSAPGKPLGLQSFTSNSGLLLVWNPASDNVGVSGYNIYLNNEFLAQSAFPLLSSTNLTTGETLCYQVEAIDGANNKSELSDELCVLYDDPGQINNPLSPQNLSVSSNGNSSVILSWTPSQSDNVLGYNIYRSDTTGNEVKIATQVSSQYQDVNLTNDTAYCYRITAFNILANESEFSDSQCATTDKDKPTNTALPNTSVSPVGKTYDTAQTVSLGCVDNNGNPCASIYYSINEADVTSNSTLYTSPIIIDENSTLRFFGIDANNNQEPPQQEVYTFTGDTIDSFVQFSSSDYQIDESIGAAEITVSRVGDMSQAISINFAASEDVSNNSATQLADFTPVTGTLNWQANESANKVFYVPIKGDALTEQTESIHLSLTSNSDNLPFGELATASINIADRNCSGILTQNIEVDTIITESCTLVDKMIHIRDANLTLSPGITLVFDDNAGLSIESDASLTATGSEEKPILLTSIDRARGYWQGVRLVRSNSSRNNLNHVTIEFGTGGITSPKANLTLYGDSSSQERINITNSTFSDGSEFGIVFSPNSIVESFSNNNITRNKLGPVSSVANVTHYLDSTSDYSGNDVDQIVVDRNNNINSSQTWETLNVPYFVNGLTANTDLKINPGATLIFDDNSELRVNRDGSLNAVGTESLPILFTSISETPGAWQGVRFIRSNDNKNVFDYVTVEYGGDSSVLGTGNVILYGDSSSTQRLRMTNSTLRLSSNNGFEFRVNSDISGFANNIISQNNGLSGKITIESVSKLDADSTYTGNGTDYIEIIDSNLNNDQSWKKLDANYLSNGISVNDNLSLEAGITIVFEQNEELRINSSGSLTAIGSVEEPIIFTGDDQSDGSWYGIRFVRSNSINNQLTNIEVHYAGKSNILGDGAITLYGDTSTHSQIEIRDSLISHSANYPIWLHSTAVINDDVTTSNTFLDNIFDTVFRK